MYELYDPVTLMFFFRNKHMMCDFGTGNNNKLNWVLEDKQELIDIVETIYRGAKKGRGLVVSPKGQYHVVVDWEGLTDHHRLFYPLPLLICLTCVHLSSYHSMRLLEGNTILRNDVGTREESTEADLLPTVNLAQFIIWNWKSIVFVKACVKKRLCCFRQHYLSTTLSEICCAKPANETRHEAAGP